MVHRRYPADLSELVPTFLDSVPRDVIGGAPLRYECTGGNQFRLYSTGLSSQAGPTWPGKQVMNWWGTPEGYWAWLQPVR
jgi:hypothetical protein